MRGSALPTALHDQVSQTQQMNTSAEMLHDSCHEALLLNEPWSAQRAVSSGASSG